MTTAATMTMCHQTLTWLSRATRLMPMMFSASSSNIRMPIVTSWPLSRPGINSVVFPYVMPALLRSGVMIVALRNAAAA